MGISCRSGFKKKGPNDMSLFRTLTISLILAGLTACGGGEDFIASPATFVSLTTEPLGINCAQGGTRINAGTDLDGSGVLELSEVQSTQFVCNGGIGNAGASGMPGSAGTTGAAGSIGSAGNNGLSTLVLMTNEVPGANCGGGGKKINVGLDINGDGILNPIEVSSSGYVCNGVTGATGQNGVNGTNSLVAMSVEPAGVHCTYGGNKIASGLDANANGVLDPAEIAQTSYLCNGAPGMVGATGPAGPGLTWVDVTSVTAQMQSNTGYLADSAAQVALKLPVSPAVGDVVRVDGIGTGGWTIAQNPGQTMVTAGISSTSTGAVWTARDSARAWFSVASSADGAKLVAGDTGGQLYTSADSGLSWTARDSNRNWRDVASSYDGTKLLAADYGEFIYTSVDSGATWAAHDVVRNWYAVASSSDGTKLVAAEYGGQLYTSLDSGSTWTPRESSRGWLSIASSADGMKLVAAAVTGQLYTSTDSGVNWIARDSNRLWFGVASSADGDKLVAAEISGQLYTSTDSGITWIPREANRNWQAVASSADGTRLVAPVNGGQIYTSTDSGLTWTPHGASRNWYGIASSADGTRLLAPDYTGQLYTSIASTSSGAGGSVSGRQYEAVELQYVGNGVFSVLSYHGTPVVQ